MRPELIDFVFRIKPKEKVVLITDSVASTRLPDGDDYELGGLPCYLLDGQVRLKNSHELAGSCVTMDQALRNALQYTSSSLEDILPSLTLNPARQIGTVDRKGCGLSYS